MGNSNSGIMLQTPLAKLIVLIVMQFLNHTLVSRRRLPLLLKSGLVQPNPRILVAILAAPPYISHDQTLSMALPPLDSHQSFIVQTVATLIKPTRQVRNYREEFVTLLLILRNRF